MKWPAPSLNLYRLSLVRRFLPKVQQDLGATYTRNLHKWLLIAPLVGLITGLTITAVAVIILRELWPTVLAYYLQHHWAIIPGLVFGSALTGVIMQLFTSDPNEHSTEEIIRSYHEHQGAINMRFFPAKLLAAITTVGFGGSAALEGPSIWRRGTRIMVMGEIAKNMASSSEPTGSPHHVDLRSRRWYVRRLSCSPYRDCVCAGNALQRRSGS